MDVHGARRPFRRERCAAILLAVSRYLPSLPELSRNVVAGLVVAFVIAWWARRGSDSNHH